MVRKVFDKGSIRPHRSLRVLQAAEELIIEGGFAGLNLDAVVERAGCSKSTVYEFFGGKEGLLIALLEQLIEQFQQQIEDAIDAGRPLEEGLHDYVSLSLERVLSDQHISLVRAILHESGRTSDIGMTYYESGPAAAIRQIADYLQSNAEMSGLEIDDPKQAARNLYEMIFGLVYPRLFGAGKKLSRKAIHAEAERIVQAFMRSHAR